MNIQRPTVDFFDAQFRRQVKKQEYVLNQFEEMALDYIKGDFLDLGAGLGNLSMEVGRRGHRVTAVDASPTAIARLTADACRERLPVNAIEASIEDWVFDQT